MRASALACPVVVYPIVILLSFDSLANMCHCKSVQPFLADLPGTPPIESAEFWQRPERVEASPDPDTATAQTIKIMCGHVKRAANDPLLQQTAAQAVSQFGGLAGDTQDAALQAACAAWWWHKLYVKFVLHDFIIANRLGEYGHLQGLISPEILVRMDKPEGDCAIFVMGIAAMLRSMDIPYELVTVKVSRREPHEYGHVYLYVVLADGRRIPLDASHGEYPGWQVPTRDILYAENQEGTPALQAWDADGNPVADQGSRFEGLHMYGLRAGLGDVQCYEDGTCEDVPTGTVTSTLPGDVLTYPAGAGQEPATPGPASTGQFVDYTTGKTYVGATYTAPAKSSSQWASFAAAMGTAGFDLAKLSAIQPGTVLSANGAILRQNPGYAVGTPTTALNLGSNSTLIIALVVVAVAGLMFMGKR